MEMFLRALTSGHNTLSPEMYQHFGGDDILKQLEKLNPGVKWVDSAIGGGEGGSQGMGKKLEFADGLMHVPTPTSGIDFLDLRPSNHGSDGVKDPSKVYHDDEYGEVTSGQNIKRKVEGIEKYAPLIGAAIAGGGPMLGGALLGAGLGGVGLTSAVTGGAAGLGAGAIPGALGAGTFSGATPSWITNLVKQGPGTLNKIESGNFNPMSLLPLIAQYAGIPSGATSGAMTLAQMTQRKK